MMSLIFNHLGLVLHHKKEDTRAHAGFFEIMLLMSIFLLPSLEAYSMDVSLKPISDRLKVQADETKWISLGAGLRGTGAWIENQSSGNLNGDFRIDNARMYLNGQFHQYLKFEVATECFFCDHQGFRNDLKRTYNILAAIAKFEFNRYLKLWGGRMVVPTERGELSGPFFHATYDGFKTPFFPSDFSVKFGNGGAGRYGLDDGATLGGNVEPGFVPGTLGYAMGIYRGLQSSPNEGPN
ncbi:hypothetical protein [Nitrosomonas sp. Is37]|uniref:hypothetical protein n=1 Tax=Nitrosomonas sp. Is37 TaxID=3080535 RepID=UPI00294AAD65|nr:hypothetical protein [Nitrosomonas sp. Is37]MDV6343770.1 hypothetical protein [Nitrosomonas sp. Is37]